MTRVIGIDPAALRLGWAVVDRKFDCYKLIDSGVMGLPRYPDEPFGDYKHRLMDFWIDNAPFLWSLCPDSFCSEILPAVGGGNFAVATQSELAKTALTTIQVMQTVDRGPDSVEWVEVAASSWKKSLHGYASKPPKKAGGKRQKVTKVDTRNAVQAIFPETKGIEWSNEEADRYDAVGIALHGLGYKHGK